MCHVFFIVLFLIDNIVDVALHEIRTVSSIADDFVFKKQGLLSTWKDPVKTA